MGSKNGIINEVGFGTILGNFGDGFGKDFGRLGRSWGSKMEAGREKKSNKKRKAKKEAIKRQKRGQEEKMTSASAADAEAGKEGFRAVGLVRPELSSTPSPHRGAGGLKPLRGDRRTQGVPKRLLPRAGISNSQQL